MKCDWNAFLKMLPQWMRTKVDMIGKEGLQEIRLRIGQPPQLVMQNYSTLIDGIVSDEDLNFCINSAYQYSPWSAPTVSCGYLTAPGGHRIGICGRMVISEGRIQTVRNVSSLCIRVARDFPGLGRQAAGLKGSILIIGSPGRGKTTLLRDMIRQKTVIESATVAVVDERGELFPLVGGRFCFYPGSHTDVLSGCSKSKGIEILIRTMNPQYVAVDEITAMEDCHAILQARGCGVSILATAHAADIEDFKERPVYKPILDGDIFPNIIVMQPDKSWRLERTSV